MPTTPPDDLIPILLAEFQAEWNPANTNGITPTFDTGWFDPDNASDHQVIIHDNPNDDAFGSSGVWGMGSGGGAHQLYRGLILVDTLAREQDDAATTAEQINAKEQAYLMSNEVRRIILANITGFSGYDYVIFMGKNRVVSPQEARPRGIRYSCRIGYQYRLHSQ